MSLCRRIPWESWGKPPNKRMQLADLTCHAPGFKATAMVLFGFRTPRDSGVC